MSKTTHIQLHSEDETRLVARFDDGITRIFQIESISDDGSSFRVTMPDGATFTPWREVTLSGWTWKCHTPGGTVHVIEYHACSERPVEDQGGDTRAIQVVMAWLECRAEAAAQGASIRSLMELNRVAHARESQMNRLLPSEPNGAARFFAKHGGQRTRRF